MRKRPAPREHLCDPTIGTDDGDNPLTMSRVLRLLLACVDDPDTNRDEAITTLFTEVGTCPNCLIAIAAGTAVITVEVINNLIDSDDQRFELTRLWDQHLAQYLDRV